MLWYDRIQQPWLICQRGTDSSAKTAIANGSSPVHLATMRGDPIKYITSHLCSNETQGNMSRKINISCHVLYNITCKFLSVLIIPNFYYILFILYLISSNSSCILLYLAVHYFIVILSCIAILLYHSMPHPISYPHCIVLCFLRQSSP